MTSQEPPETATLRLVSGQTKSVTRQQVLAAAESMPPGDPDQVQVQVHGRRVSPVGVVAQAAAVPSSEIRLAEARALLHKLGLAKNPRSKGHRRPEASREGPVPPEQRSDLTSTGIFRLETARALRRRPGSWAVVSDGRVVSDASSLSEAIQIARQAGVAGPISVIKVPQSGQVRGPE